VELLQPEKVSTVPERCRRSCVRRRRTHGEGDRGNAVAVTLRDPGRELLMMGPNKWAGWYGPAWQQSF
jgi:hypothetical protein